MSDAISYMKEQATLLTQKAAALSKITSLMIVSEDQLIENTKSFIVTHREIIHSMPREIITDSDFTDFDFETSGEATRFVTSYCKQLLEESIDKLAVLDDSESTKIMSSLWTQELTDFIRRINEEYNNPDL